MALVLVVFDVLLVLTMVWLAWRSVVARDPFRCAVGFIVLGLVLSLTWLRLRAPDVALAEAAVGSGLTGALILAHLARTRERPESRSSEPGSDGGGGR